MLQRLCEKEKMKNQDQILIGLTFARYEEKAEDRTTRGWVENLAGVVPALWGEALNFLDLPACLSTLSTAGRFATFSIKRKSRLNPYSGQKRVCPWTENGPAGFGPYEHQACPPRPAKSDLSSGEQKRPVREQAIEKK